jgi:hypothetical protein
MTLDTIKAHVDTANVESYIRDAFISLGVDAANIKSVYRSPNGFAPRSNRYAVTLFRGVRLSAVAVNQVNGFSGAVWNGSVCYILVGKE